LLTEVFPASAMNQQPCGHRIDDTARLAGGQIQPLSNVNDKARARRLLAKHH
jgi:hypothetical protein